MGVPHMTSFCWCLGLEAGSMLIGVVHLIVSITLMVICSIFAESTRQYIGTVEDAGDEVYTKWYKLAVTFAVLSVFHIGFAVMLLVSVYKRWSLGLRVWVGVVATVAGGALLLVPLSAALCGVSGSGSEIFLSFLEGLLFFGFLAYCVLCVYSYYLMLKSSEDMAGPKDEY